MMKEVRTWMSVSLGLALGLVLLAAPAAGQPAEGVVRVTDPADLAAMGIGADAVVYRVPGAEKPQHHAAGSQPLEFGIAASGWSSYNGNQFQGRVSTYAYTTVNGAGDVYFSGGDTFADAQVSMPSGAIWESVRWWGNDSNAADLTFFVFKTCLPAFSSGPPVLTLLASGTSTGTPGDASDVITIPGTETVDNQACTYFVRHRWDAAASTLRLYKVRAQWVRQVSPAPVTATFTDVPTSHPQFQFVEALVASGITSGCNVSPPQYCPDSPLTRGQMAVFLSRALGLHWPN